MEFPPEIILCIGPSLSHHDLTRCIRVNKTWHQVLTSLLYHSIDETASKKPSIIALKKYMNLIQDAKVIAEGPYLIELAECRSMLNLRHLRLLIKEGIGFTQSTSDLLKSTPHLSGLSVEGSPRYGKDFPLQSILEGCLPSLRKLELNGVHVSKLALQLIVNLGSTLERLSVLHCNIDSVDSPELFATTDNFPRLPRISELEFKGFKGQLDLGAWLEHCPKTRTLTWALWSLSLSQSPELNLSVEAPRWSCIRSLSLCGDNTKLSDHQLSLILDACAPLTKLDIAQSGFSIKSFFSLERHFATLEYLDLTYGECVLSWMSQSIMASCPRLIYLSTYVLLGCDLVQGATAEARRKQGPASTFGSRLGDPSLLKEKMDPLIQEKFLARDVTLVRPWVCLGLRTLKVTIAETEPEWQESIFERISTLTELRVLDISMDYYYNGSNSLDLCLNSGLEYLGSLTHLETFYFNDTRQFMEMEDVEWMLYAWPNLKNLSREFNLTPKKNTKLCKLVERHFSEIESEEEEYF
ncbi:hypothetical protein EMPS_06866 [Entomortierella parvispora]|uniref:F-box domain-containing protein n=1 Tax=Entomortierella parvispora TaxID=205924 RepID=A0A9P3HDT3_9FUNG|nr:hypothetical protein EMPS_06866 [Entomortierella parvispora]